MILQEHVGGHGYLTADGRLDPRLVGKRLIYCGLRWLSKISRYLKAKMLCVEQID